MKSDYESFWDNHINDPDNFMQSSMEPFDNPVRVKIAELAENGQSVLDVGSASCISYPLFKGKKQYVGIDFTHKFLETARKQHKDVIVVHGDVRHLPFTDNSFSTAYTKDVLIHLGPGDYKTVLTEMWRVAKNQILVVIGSSLSQTDTDYKIYIQFKDQPECGLFFSNTYNKQEFLGLITNLPNFESYEIVDGIPIENSSDLYARDVRQLIIVKRRLNPY